MEYIIKNLEKINKPKYYLILANFLIVLFLILVNNLGMLPMKTGDFIFLSVIVLIFSLYRPGWSFLIFVGMIALENINLAPSKIGIAIRPYQLFGAMTMLAVLGRVIFKKANIKFPKPKWFDYVLLIFVLSGFVSAVFSVSRGASLKQSVVAVSFFVLYFLVRTFIQNLEDVKKIMPFFLSSSIVVVIYGIFQNIRFLRGLNPFETMPGRPNATFTEADWLGIFVTLLLAVLYSIIYFVNKKYSENDSAQISNFQFLPPQRDPAKAVAISNEISNLKSQISFTGYWLLATSNFFLVPVYIILILTVSRSAWLGAGFVTLVFLKSMFTNFSFHPKNWHWKEFLKHLAFVAGAGIVSLGIVYVFHLTNFQLFNRAQSTGSGLQKITIACQGGLDDVVPQTIWNVSELENYHCWHINLEDIEKEKALGNNVMEIYRTDPNVNIRKVIYQKSVEQIKLHPIFGIGWGNIGKILGTDERGASLNSSNIFLEIYLGSGAIGFLAFLAIWVYIFVKSIIYCVRKDFESKIIGLFIVLGFFAFFIPNLFNAGIFLGILWVWMGVVLSLSLNKIK